MENSSFSVMTVQTLIPSFTMHQTQYDCVCKSKEDVVHRTFGLQQPVTQSNPHTTKEKLV